MFPIPRLLANTDLFAGPRALMALRGIGSARTLLLTGGSLAPHLRHEIKRMLLAEQVVEVIRPGGGDPDWDGVEGVMGRLSGGMPDLIVAVGGGAVMDLARLVMLRIGWPEGEGERLYRPFAAPPLKDNLRLCAIPTTAGSGAEASSSALVIDRATGTKKAVVTHDFLFDVVLLDPRFLSGIPRPVMMAGVIDAMTHAVEGFVSNVDNPMADLLAESALERLGRLGLCWLEDAEDGAVVQELQFAACLAGMVQNQCGVGICHSLAHQLARFGVGHGEANGVFLSRVLEFNSGEDKVARRLETLESRIGFSIAQRVGDFQRAGGLAVDLAALTRRDGIDLSTVDPCVLAQDALVDICTRFNPRAVTREELVSFWQTSMVPHANPRGSV
ncbi:MAG: iron-containing alcohol dehydrogenase [Magnetococcales bacterium]|nr:iron-containing alcohol dehydrogenase [Magnetococcales bacterium]